VNASGLEYLAPAIHFSNWLKNENLDIGLLEINIEGGEYNLLSDLIESRQIKRIKTLLIQFHNNERNSEFQRASIRHLLQETHEQIFNYDWVWEKWKLKDDKQI
jgi:hypothetical protein